MGGLQYAFVKGINPRLGHSFLSQTYLDLDAKPYFPHQEDGVTNRSPCVKAGGLNEIMCETLNRVSCSIQTPSISIIINLLVYSLWRSAILIETLNS